MCASIRELQDRLLTTTSREEKIGLLNELAYAQRYIDINQTRQFATQALQLASEPPTPLLDGQCYSRAMLSVVDIFVGNYEKALNDLCEIETQFSEEWFTPRTRAWVSLQLGYCYVGLSNSPHALGYFLSALHIAVEHQLREIEYYAQLGLGTTYAQLENFNEAMQADERALQLARELHDNNKIFIATSNLAISYLDRGEAQKALDIQESAMPLFKQDDTASSLASVNMTRARAYAKLNRLDLAEPLIEDVLREYANGQFKDDLAEALQLRAELYEQSGQFAVARTYFEQALALAQKIGNKDRQANIHKRLAGVNRQLAQLSAALSHYEAFHQLRSEMFNQQADLRMKSLEVLHRMAVSRQQAEMLQRQNADLEARVAVRTIELEEALIREQAIAHELARALAAEEEVGRLKSQIITTVSHEFRTPLAIITTSVELLTRFGDNMTAERKAGIERRIYNAVFNLRDLIQDIVMVDAAHNRDITPHLTTLPFVDFCHDLENRMRDDLGYPPHMNIEYDPLDTIIRIDEGLIRQVVFDLLSNAVKYSNPGYPITASLALAESDLIVVVTDQGIGIPAHDIERIFQLFYRGSNVSTRSGLGLGLYIVDKLVHAMEGTVTAESPGPEQGSTFRVTVPVKIDVAEGMTKSA